MAVTVTEQLMLLQKAKDYGENAVESLTTANDEFSTGSLIIGILALVTSLGQHTLSKAYLELAIGDYTNLAGEINRLLGWNFNSTNLTDEQLLAILIKLLQQLQQKETLEAKFQVIRTALQADVNADITQALSEYKSEIETLFGVSLTIDNNGFAWSLAGIHFARQGLEATAEAFERWANDYIEANSLQFVVNRYELYRRIMGQMSFENIGEVRTNVAISEMSTIKVYQRPKFIDYWVYETELGIQYTPFTKYDGTTNEEPSGYTDADDDDKSIESLPQYTNDQYNPLDLVNIVPSNPLRQAFMTPNNFIHELGHSFSRYAGVGFMLMGSMEQILTDSSTPKPDLSRDGLGNPTTTDLFYEHAQVKDDDSDGEAEFDPLSGTDNYAETSYLLYDLFGKNYSLWTSNYYPFSNTNARVDVFAHNYALNADPSIQTVETVADGFLNWIRNSFDGTTSNGSEWIQFMLENVGIFIRNTVAWQVKPVVYYFVHGDITATPIMSGTVKNGTYGVRLYPSSPSPDTTRIGNVTERLDSNIPIYGWWSGATGDSASNYWLLVSDAQLRLLWVAENGISHDETLLNANHEIQPNTVSPIRSLDLNDFLIITGQI